MDDTLLYFTPDSTTLNESSILNDVCDAGATYSRVTALRHDTPSLSSFYFSRHGGSQQKRGACYESLDLLDGRSLDLGLGDSSISLASKGSSATACNAISSGKESESLSSLGHVNFSLHLSKEEEEEEEEKIPILGNVSCSTRTPTVGDQRPMLDLELSLTIGAAESDVTSVTPGSCLTPSSTSFRNNAEMAAIASTVQLVDEGSTTSQWRFRSLVPPLLAPWNTGTAATFDCVIGHINPALDVSNTSSTMINGPMRQQCSTSFKTCQVKGCGKGARGASGRCIAHGGGRRCQKTGCQKGAEGKTVFCKAHGGGRRCQQLGCTKSAEGRTDYCIAHGGGRRCGHEGCTRAARGKSGLCIRHGGGKRCKVENCSRSAEGISGLCISHGGGRRCLHPACTKGAQGSTMFCKAHGGGKRCTAQGCTKGAEGSTPFCKGHGGGKRCTFQGGGVCPRSVHGGTLFCVAHGGGKRCTAPECTKSARGRTAYCVRHGGGKRCKYEGCLKSAQGSTDFCKAHGGGKRCSWGQVRSGFSGQVAGPCEKFARGRTGLCAAHGAQIQDKQVHGGGGFLDRTQNQNPISSNRKKKEPVDVKNSPAEGLKTQEDRGRNLVDLNNYGLRDHGHHQSISLCISPVNEIVDSEIGASVKFSLPEGRVHGGGLMAMLRSSAVFGSSCDGKVEPGKSSLMPPCSWL